MLHGQLWVDLRVDGAKLKRDSRQTAASVTTLFPLNIFHDFPWPVIFMTFHAWKIPFLNSTTFQDAYGNHAKTAGFSQTRFCYKKSQKRPVGHLFIAVYTSWPTDRGVYPLHLRGENPPLRLTPSPLPFSHPNLRREKTKFLAKNFRARTIGVLPPAHATASKSTWSSWRDHKVDWQRAHGCLCGKYTIFMKHLYKLLTNALRYSDLTVTSTAHIKILKFICTYRIGGAIWGSRGAMAPPIIWLGGLYCIWPPQYFAFTV